jgi:DNA-binding NarL/FixJ family response regulator
MKLSFLVHNSFMTENRVMVVEDDPFTRSTLCAALRIHGITLVGESESATNALALAKSLLPSAVLIDLDLGKGPTGIDLSHALRRLKRDIGIIFLTSYEDPRFLRPNLPPLPAGAEYLVKKSVTDIALVTKAICRAIISGQEVAKGKKAQSTSIGAQISKLSTIQIETLRLLSQGMTNSEIAKTRFITEKSVEQTVSRIAKFLKLPQNSTHNQRVHMARVFFRMTGSPPPE